MRRNFFLIAILLFCSAFSRSTTFDDREICEQVGGVWRQFGNGCADECESRLNELAVCTKVMINACECVKARCWNDEEKKCVALSEYKKTYDLRVSEEKKINEEAKKEREEEFAESKKSILNNLAQNKSPNQNNGAVEQKLNPVEAKIQNPTPEVTNVTPVTPPAGGPPSAVVNNPPPVPPMFLQQEQEKKKLEEQKTKEEKKKDPQVPLTTIPGLPVIPLP